MGSFIRKKSNSPMKYHGVGVVDGKEQIPFLSFPALDEVKGFKHMVTTREGGVSTGYARSLSFRTEEDLRENVLENYRRAAAVFGKGIGDIAISDQTHTVNVKVIRKEDAGKGLVKNIDYNDIDGLVTNEKGVILCIITADCVPLFFIDPVKKAIGLSHSGWKGTKDRIGERTIELMNKEYGSDPSDIIAAIGPSICRDCYEVGEDVAGQFLREPFMDGEDSFDAGDSSKEGEAVINVSDKEEYGAQNGSEKRVLIPKPGVIGKSLLDLWEANRRVLIKAGIKPENISVTDICTCCNPDLLFSHRYTKGKRGNIGSFLMVEG